MRANLDHIAILVDSIDTVQPKVKELGLACSSVDEFPSEGTREMYVGADGADGRLLFMQAIGEGPYRGE